MSNQENSTITEKLSELQKMVDWFESDDFVIEEAMNQYEKAKRLANEITDELKMFKNQIVEIKKDFSKD